MLGRVWNSLEYDFQFTSVPQTLYKLINTNRQILSIISQIFEKSSLFGSMTLSLVKPDWDKPIPIELQTLWYSNRDLKY